MYALPPKLHPTQSPFAPLLSPLAFLLAVPCVPTHTTDRNTYLPVPNKPEHNLGRSLSLVRNSLSPFLAPARFACSKNTAPANMRRTPEDSPRAPRQDAESLPGSA